jgi:hypothetical protein
LSFTFRYDYLLLPRMLVRSQVPLRFDREVSKSKVVQVVIAAGRRNARDADLRKR